jgi:hypothetical protein
VPAHDGVGRDDCRDSVKDPAAESFALGCDTAALIIGQIDAPPTKLFLQDAVLLDQILDQLGLVPVDPASEGREEESQWEAIRHHAR